MKFLGILIIFLFSNVAFANEPVRLVNPDENTKIEFNLDKKAIEFSGNLQIEKGEAVFVAILLDDNENELKRTNVNQNGYYNFGSVDKGRYYLKLENTLKKQEEFQDKAANNIFDLQYVNQKKLLID